ncbi:MAG: Na(+)-translocating NADH-quinone reductase subunit A, partial [Planctomycetes bacterium]|nr:Na(+)-translocating NADH-quinone reductase subunit A [Planctomycetota bacterium]
MISITKGLDLPIAGEPKQTIETGPAVTTVALVADDYIGMKPTMIVKQGDSVRLGQLLFEDKMNLGVRFTSPGCGTVAAINRGAKRALQSVIVELEGNDEETFQSYHDSDLSALTREQVRSNLLNSGLWTCIRSRPYGKLPHPESTPHSLFVTAMDSNPLAADPEIIIGENEPAFVYGLQVVRHLTEGKLFLCKAPGTTIAGSDLDFVTVEEFSGPHPAGLPGTHIHFLDPVSDKKTVWHLNYQDVIAIGKLFATGKLSVERVISLGGPSVKNPRLLRTRIGANTGDLTREELEGETEDNRVVSGSVLSGRTAVEPFDFLGRFHLQLSALPEGRERLFLGWQRPGFDTFSVKRVFASAFMGAGKKFRFNTSTEGSNRAMVPIGMYEKVMPLDIIPTFLLRA